jgi:chitinase
MTKSCTHSPTLRGYLATRLAGKTAEALSPLPPSGERAGVGGQSSAFRPLPHFYFRWLLQSGITKFLWLALVSILIFGGSLRAHAGLWATAYYTGYEQSAMPASNIDFTAVTHIVHFSLVPNPDGSLNSTANGLNPEASSDLITRAHAAGKRVLVCIGGAESQRGFQGATSPANLTNFVNNLVGFMNSHGYDGLDVDWEPLPVSDAAQYTNFINELHAALAKVPSPKLMTAAVAAYPVWGDLPAPSYSMLASVQNQLDQINIMAYDLSGPYDGWITWFNAPIYDGGTRFAGTHELLPSLDGAVSNFISNGMAASKLGVGIPFYGCAWTGGSGGNVPHGGVTLPRQNWKNAPVFAPVNYKTLLTTYSESNSYHWDASSQAAYLSLTNGNNKFISFDDPRSCEAKVDYARKRGLGGIMIWELALDYSATQPAGHRSPLLETIKRSLAATATAETNRAAGNAQALQPADPNASPELRR